MTDALLMEAKKDALRQTQDGLWKVSLTVKPGDMPPALLAAPMGQRLAVVITALVDNEPVKPGNIFPEEVKRREKSEGAKAVIRAATLCRDPEFQAWLCGQRDEPASEAHAAILLRERLGIASRRDLAVDPAALDRFLNVETEFRYREHSR